MPGVAHASAKNGRSLLWANLTHEKMETMKKLMYVLLVLVGIGVVACLMTRKRTEARHQWDDALSQVPTPEDQPVA